MTGLDIDDLILAEYGEGVEWEIHWQTGVERMERMCFLRIYPPGREGPLLWQWSSMPVPLPQEDGISYESFGSWIRRAISEGGIRLRVMDSPRKDGE